MRNRSRLERCAQSRRSARTWPFGAGWLRRAEHVVLLPRMQARGASCRPCVRTNPGIRPRRQPGTWHAWMITDQRCCSRARPTFLPGQAEVAPRIARRPDRRSRDRGRRRPGTRWQPRRITGL